ncbi:hypothetical protein CCUS01_04288 [Colletotrichum cuscutae]|uniref:Uncharacterized protein n=1 Tax=Colletotrichum cuscutae TaxID=1209917 RepID=A0AAI9Y6V9_9PEZI|nr:hypothetical protein CCUS01_04288 [Colletotrichum cuscutae]
MREWRRMLGSRLVFEFGILKFSLRLLVFLLHGRVVAAMHATWLG